STRHNRLTRIAVALWRRVHQPLVVPGVPCQQPHANPKPNKGAKPHGRYATGILSNPVIFLQPPNPHYSSELGIVGLRVRLTCCQDKVSINTRRPIMSIHPAWQQTL